MQAFDIAWSFLKADFPPDDEHRLLPSDDEHSFRLEAGPKNLYHVVTWDDGKSLFLDGDSQTQFLQEMKEASEHPDSDAEHMENLFGIGSEYHGIADSYET